MDLTPTESPPLLPAPAAQPRWLLVRSILFVAVNLVLGHLLFVQGSGLNYATASAFWMGDWRAGIVALANQLLVAAWLVVVLSGRPPAERHQPGVLTALGIVVASLVTFTGAFLMTLKHLLMISGSVVGDQPFLTMSFLTRNLAVYAHVNGLGGLPTFAAVVAAVWLALGVGGHWRRASGLLDRVGLGVGAALLVLGLFGHLIGPRF